MKILFLCDNFPPEVNAPATRTYEHCKRWVASGAAVTVITCAPNFPHGRVYPGYRNRLRTVEDVDGIRVVRVWSYMAANTGFLRRVLDFVSFALSASMFGLLEPADIIVASSPQFFTAMAGCFLSITRRRPWVFELRDLWPESVSAVGQLAKAGRLYRLLEAIELLLYRHATRVVSVSPAFVANLAGRGIDPRKVDIVTNGADLSLFAPRPRNDRLRGELGLSGEFVVGYVGTHGLAHDLDMVVRCAHRLRERGFHFLFVGDGAEKERLQRFASALELSNVTFHHSVPKAEVPNWLAACDAVLVPLARSETFKSVIPSKIFETAAMGLPILLGVDGQARSLVEEFGAGLYFEPGNAEALAEALRRLEQDVVLRTRLSAAGRLLAAVYDRRNRADSMLTILARQARERRASMLNEIGEPAQ
jgi:glycosyltransferase involved in cell wall biosynthesis